MSSNASRRKGTAKVMKTVRRVHLYAGLALCPLVLLFGVSAFLFNHPAAFNRTVESHGPELVEETAFVEEEFAPDLAGQLAVAIQKRLDEQANDPSQDAGATGHVLVFRERDSAEYRRSPSIEWTEGGDRHSIRLRSDGGYEVTRAPRRESAEPIRVELDDLDALKSRFEADAKRVASRLGVDDETVRVSRMPTLRFAAELDGVPQVVDVDLSRGSATISPKVEAEPPGWRRLLLRMHTAHTYPADDPIRWAWALLVDVTAIAMVMFGLSGLAMWWQMKNLRRRGALWTGIGVVAFAVMTTLMRSAMAG